MIHEIFGIKNNVVDLSAYAVAKEIEKIVLFSGNDDFFRANMYKGHFIYDVRIEGYRNPKRI